MALLTSCAVFNSRNTSSLTCSRIRLLWMVTNSLTLFTGVMARSQYISRVYKHGIYFDCAVSSEDLKVFYSPRAINTSIRGNCSLIEKSRTVEVEFWVCSHCPVQFRKWRPKNFNVLVKQISGWTKDLYTAKAAD